MQFEFRHVNCQQIKYLYNFNTTHNNCYTTIYTSGSLILLAVKITDPAIPKNSLGSSQPEVKLAS